jgi:polysaccharide biosynthesis protein PelF
MNTFPTAKSVDIALLLEGTYPFVRGGVSSWVHQLILGFPEYRFAAIFLGSERGAYAGIRYELPPNLVHLEAHYLYEIESGDVRKNQASADPQAFTDVHAMHDAFAATGGCPRHLLAKNADHLLSGRMHEGHFEESREAWEMITSLYRKQGADTAFLDYFWTVRSMHAPIWALARVARNLIPARAYHSASTGYAGFLGALLAQKHKRPLLLSEHGLYTKERKIDLMQSAWIRESGHSQGAEAPEGGVLRQLWIRFFEALGKATYVTANPVVSLYDGIRKQQIQDGAEAAHTLCIPNGISLVRYQALRSKQTLPPAPVFSLIGRVVPIKDIKTFIRAMQAVRQTLPAAEGWIVGPGEEDPTYFEECRALVESLGLSACVRFLGFQNIDDILPRTAVLVLSSISEALPLTLLEGFAAGVPAVATDVGSCRQLILGKADDAEDLALGQAGRVVGIGDPTALADAMTGLFSNSREWEKAKVTAMSRAERYYTDGKMLDSYRAIYRKAIGDNLNPGVNQGMTQASSQGRP